MKVTDKILCLEIHIIRLNDDVFNPKLLYSDIHYKLKTTVKYIYTAFTHYIKKLEKSNVFL